MLQLVRNAGRVEDDVERDAAFAAATDVAEVRRWLEIGMGRQAAQLETVAPAMPGPGRGHTVEEKKGHDGPSFEEVPKRTARGTMTIAAARRSIVVAEVVCPWQHIRNMTSRERDKAITFRMTAEEFQMLAVVSQRTGLSKSDVLRQGIREWYAKTDTPTPPTPAPKPRGSKRGK